MKCPFCSQEILEDSVFCGFCGKAIPPKPVGKEAVHQVQAPSGRAAVPAGKPKGKKPSRPGKRRTALRIWGVCLLLALVSGSVLGFLTVRRVISLDFLRLEPVFIWTDFQEGEVQSTPVPEDGLEKDKEHPEG